MKIFLQLIGFLFLLGSCAPFYLTASGIVVDKETRQPVKNALMVFPNLEKGDTFITDSTGRFLYRKLSTETAKFNITAPGYRSKKVKIKHANKLITVELKKK